MAVTEQEGAEGAALSSSPPAPSTPPSPPPPPPPPPPAPAPPTPPPPARRPGKARVLSEADLDLDFDLESGDVHRHGSGASHEVSVSSSWPSQQQQQQQQQLARWQQQQQGVDRVPAGGAGPCHGFAPEQRSGEWINAGYADNIFGPTAHGRRIIPAARAARVRGRLLAAAGVSGAYAAAELTAAHLSGRAVTPGCVRLVT
jgi:hypothetical protein